MKVLKFVLTHRRWFMISSPDLVLAVREQKNRGGGGEGKGGNEIWQNTIAWARIVNCACPKSAMLSCVQYSYRVRYRVAFCFKKHGSLNLKPKTQALICFEGCSAAGQQVLAVLPTGYGKNWTDLRAVAAKHVGNRNVSVF